MQGSLIVALLVGCSGFCIAQDQSPGTLDLCAVAANLKGYSGREVRITAFFAVGRENVVLYDPKCQDGEPMVWVEFLISTLNDAAVCSEPSSRTE